MKTIDPLRRTAPSVGVGVVLLDDSGQILLGQRCKPKEAVSWCLPGGRVESGETFEQAAARELAEETGIAHATEACAFTLVIDHREAAGEITVGVLMRVSTAQARVLEPHVFASWRWSLPSRVPDPLFPATALVLDAWTRRGVNHETAMYALRPQMPITQPGAMDA